MKSKPGLSVRKLLTFSEFHFRVLRIIMISYAGVMIGFAAFSLFAKEKIDLAHEIAQLSAVNYLKNQTKSGVNLPAVDDNVAQSLLGMRIYTSSVHQRYNTVGPKDLAIVNKVELIRVKAQRKHNGNDVSLVRFKQIE